MLARSYSTLSQAATVADPGNIMYPNLLFSRFIMLLRIIYMKYFILLIKYYDILDPNLYISPNAPYNIPNTPSHILKHNLNHPLTHQLTYPQTYLDDVGYDMPYPHPNTPCNIP